MLIGKKMQSSPGLRGVISLKSRSMLIAAGGVTLVGNVAFATTFTWTRGALNNNWDNAGNWSTASGPLAPPLVQPIGDTTDIVYAGTVTTGTNSLTSSSLRRDYSINSLFFDAAFNHQTGTSTYNVNTPSTLLAGQTSAHLSLGAGGIVSNVNTFNVTIGRNAAIAAGNAELILTAPQTWSLNAAGTFSAGTITFTINRVIRGDFAVSKEGTGLLVLGEQNPNWTGGLILNNGAVRTGGNAGDNAHFGTGAITAVTDNQVTITASTVNGLGDNRLFQNDFVLGGSGTFEFAGSFNLGLGTMSTVTLQTQKKWDISRITAIDGNITGPGGIDKGGGGMLVLNTANDYAGPTNLFEGVVQVRHNAGLNAGTNPVSVGEDSSLELSNGVTISGKPLSIAGVGNVDDSPPPGVDTNQGALRNRDGNNTWTGPVTVTAGNTYVQVENGILNLSGGVSGDGTASMRVAAVGAGATELDAKHFRLGGLQIDANTKVKVNASGVSADGRSTVNTLAIAGTPTLPTAQLDITDNALVVDYTGASPVADVAALIASGRAGGSWAGNGITSSTAAANTTIAAVGYAEASEGVPAIFGTVDGDAVLVRYTRLGDATLDGTTNINDFSRLAANFNLPGGWSKGDFNFDGMTNIGDFSLLAANFNQSIAGGTPGRAGAVPEPTGALVVLGAAAALKCHRRRR